MTKEYLKMADTFKGSVFHYDNAKYLADADGYCGEFNERDFTLYAAHAINSHDELVAEVERLRGELSVVGSVLNEVDRVISERIKNGAYDLDDISAEVSQVIERINRDDY